LLAVRILVALGVPVEIAPLLPAAHRGHEGVAEVVLALRVCLDIFPLEVGAAAAGDVLAANGGSGECTHRLPSFRTVCTRSMVALLCGRTESAGRVSAEQARRCPEGRQQAVVWTGSFGQSPHDFWLQPKLPPALLILPAPFADNVRIHKDNRPQTPRALRHLARQNRLAPPVRRRIHRACTSAARAMVPQPAPEDEQFFDRPDLLPTLSAAGTLNSNTILWYFYNSPWFDQGSNNNSLLRQVGGTPQQELIFHNRLAFEERLRTDYPYGTQYVVAYEPKGDGEPWVIQRQEKSVDENTGKTAATAVTATYYTQGTRIVMAKSVLDVLQTRMLSVSTQLQELLELSEDLSHFSPATGHTYIPPSFDLAKPSSASRAGSRAGSPAPEQSQTQAQSQSQSQSQSQTQPTAQPTADPFETFSDAFFLRSLDRTEAYFEEYVDENPLQGEPGSFVLTHSWRNTVTRREEEKKRAEHAAAQHAAAAQAATQPSQLSITTTGGLSQTQSGLQSSTSTPKPATPATESFSRKASVASQQKPAKEKRRKSKGPGSLASPVTPTGPQI
jgi:mediator of RNA polymerase II transcription subunit 6